MGGLLSICMGPDSHALALEAVRRGDDKLLLVLLGAKGGKRVRINERNPKHEGFTLLAEAAALGHNRVVKVLLDRGATPDTSTDGGFTPLTLALRSGHDGTAQILVNSGAGLDASDSAYGKTALLWAVENKASGTIIKLLCDKGCDLDAKSRQGLTALMLAADANNADIVRVLLQAGANPKTQDHRAGTALSRAKDKHFSVVAGLLMDATAARERKDSAAKAATGGGGRPSRADSGADEHDMAQRRRSSSGSKLMAGKASARATARASMRARSIMRARARAKSARTRTLISYPPRPPHARALPSFRVRAQAALGSKATDLFAGGRASGAEAATKERMKDKVFKSMSLDASLAGR